ncbi:hypothetical protein C1645_812284 [Glomus cerebriforme]|uniref:OTU domain-containing protein n=1 Tax=Glomus cerebriforme TaxID=658196 RepID=A0A397TKN3_9GLOM|nr:hypothetical protein C1645_812284 [Glomus cerebriforme]
MNNNNLNEQLFNINKFLSTSPSPNIQSVQNYTSTIDTSCIFSINFNTPYETLPPLAKVDTAAEKILHMQYPHLTPANVLSNGNCLLNSISLIFTKDQILAPQFRLAMIIELMKYADFYLSQKLFEEDYYFSDAALNSAKNPSMPTTYNKEREYIGEIAYMSKSHRFCSIIGIYGLASVIQRPIMSIYPPTISQLISTLYHKLIEPRIKVYSKCITIMWTSSSGKWNVNDPLPQTNHFVPVFKASSPFSSLKLKKNKYECELDVEMHDDLRLNECRLDVEMHVNLESNKRELDVEMHNDLQLNECGLQLNEDIFESEKWDGNYETESSSNADVFILLF